MSGETVQRRLEVAGEGDGVEELRPPVKRSQEHRSDLRELLLVSHN